MSGINVGTAYYDGLVYVNMPYFGTMNIDPVRNTSIAGTDARILNIEKEQREELENKQYYTVLFAAPDGVQPSMLKNILAKHGPSPEFYDAAMKAYIAGNGSAASYNDLWAALANMKSEAQKQKTQEYLDRDFPGKNTITVYRGWANESTSAEDAASWTPSPSVAVFFAGKNGEDPRCSIGEVSKDDVLEYFPIDRANGAEPETIVMPGKVHVTSIVKMLSAKDNEIFDLTDNILGLYTDYREILALLYAKKTGGLSDHDAFHSLRVLMHALILAEMEDVDMVGKLRLAEAAIFHDFGRTENGTEAGHGTASRRMYEEMGGQDAFVSCIIEAHCMTRKGIKNLVRGQEFTKKEKEKLQQLIDIFMDADALDRTRFHPASADWVNVEMLRTASAVKLVPFAMDCVDRLKFPEGIGEEFIKATDSIEDMLKSVRIAHIQRI